MPKVVFKDVDREVEASPGDNLLELARRAGAPTGSHCGGHATGWLSACLFILLGAVVCEIRSAQKTEAKPMRTSARKLNPPLIACILR